MEIAVQIDQLSKRFGEHLVLEGISASFEKGKRIALAGPDGAGKTTLMRILTGLLKPSEGVYSTVSPIGYMPQRFGLYEDLTVMQNFSLYADLVGVGQEGGVFEKLLSFTGLAPFRDRLAGRLSGGMKQKLGLACALLQKPSLLLLDEPTVGVDPRSRRELWKIVSGLVEEGITVLWSTAYLDEAAQCDWVLLLNEGKILYQGKPGDLLHRVEGRVWKVSGLQEGRREALKKLLADPEVLDGVIQGSDLRLVVKTAGEVFPVSGGEGERVKTEPRFEDGFMDLLGGLPKERRLELKGVASSGEKKVVIAAEGLTKRFGTFTATDQVTFEVKEGEVFGLLGPNGAGKSTTFKMACGLLHPTAGRVLVKGEVLENAKAEVRAEIGYMAQKFSLYGDLSVLQNLRFFSGAYHLSGEEQKKRIQEMVERFELKRYLDASADVLPAGFKQRLALACAIMHQPSILFLDEPTSGVDPITRRQFWSVINDLVEKGVTVLVTTHFMDEAEYCDRIALIHQSKLIKMGTPDSLKKEAATPECPSPTLEEAFLTLLDRHEGRAK